MSELMKKLDKEATQRARKAINNHFVNSNDLDDINYNNYKQNIIKQITLSESQLNISVSSKLDALKRAYDIIDESSIKLNKLLNNLNKINQKINLTNTTINKYIYLKYIHHAKENITKVINLVELFTDIPNKIVKIKDLLDENDNIIHFKEIYLDIIQLDSLRDGLINETNNDLYINNTVLKQTINNYFINVPKLFDKLIEQIKNNLNTYLLNDTSTSYELILTFEIIEMHIEYVNRRYKNNDFKNPNNFKNFQEQIDKTIKEIFDIKMTTAFIQCKESAEYENQPISSILKTSTSLLHFLNDTLSEINICVPPRYNILTIYINLFHDYIFQQISSLITNQSLNKINLNNILDILNWIEYYKAQISVYQPIENVQQIFLESNTNNNNMSSLSKLFLLSEDLSNEYLYRIKVQMQEWFDNITKQELNIIKTTTGLLITTNPEDMFNILYIQISIAVEKLPSTYLYNVISTLLQILREIQRQTYDNLSNHWRSYEIDVLCSIINDNQRMQEKTDEFSNYVLSLPGLDNNDNNKDIIQNMLEESSSEYIALSVTAVNFLARNTLTDLEDPVFSKLFTAEWENGEALISILTATLDDYFKDIFIWCNEYFHTKYCKEIFYLVITLYIMSIRKIANGAFRFINEITVANRLIKDRDILEEYFNRYNKELARGGLKLDKDNKSSISPITYELQIFKSLALIITTTNINSINPIEKDIKLVLSRYGMDGLKLLIAIYLSNPIYKKTDKQIFIEKLIKYYDVNYDKDKFVVLDKYKVVDLNITDTNVILSYFNPNISTTGASTMADNVSSHGNSAVHTSKTTKSMFWSKSKSAVDKTY